MDEDIIMTINFDDFSKRLKKVLEARKTHETNAVRGGWSFDRGAETIYYEACSVLLQMNTEQIRASMKGVEEDDADC